MSSIPPVPNTRITGLLTRQRLTAQYQNDQLDLFRLQEQISTGLRVTLPSQDAPAALRAISFQRLLDRKGQFESNVESGLRFLSSTDNTLGGNKGVSSVLNDIKAETLGVVGTVTTDEQREAAIVAINGALDNLVKAANRQFNGRHLFAGSQASQPPYELVDGNVVYHGDNREIKNYSDINVLFSTSISGQEVFGGISAAVQGKVDLNPSLDADTLLSSLQDGRGINPNGSLQIADTISNEVSVVDISQATTVGDVVRLIEDNPPEGTQVDVTITGNGLEVSLFGGSLAISEVGAGTTARELGLTGLGNPTTIVSEDLDPVLIKTTPLENLLGTKSRAMLVSGAGDDNNDIFVEASANGAALNGVTIQIVDGGDIGDNVGVVYDDLGKTLTISVDDDEGTTANQVIDAINAEGTFRAALDRGDSETPKKAGTGTVEFGATAVTSGGAGDNLDRSSGIRVVNGGQTFDITFEGDETVEDLLNTLNRSEAGVLAEINATGTGINIRSRASGNDFAIGEIDGGTTATQLGIRTYGTDSLLRDFNFGLGVPTKEALPLNLSASQPAIITSDGNQFTVDLSAVTDVNDAITAINTDVDNLGFVTAQLSTDGKLQLIDNTVGTGRLSLAPSGDPIPALPNGLDVEIAAIDFNITAKDDTSFAIDVSGAETVGDVLGLINGAAGNGGRVTARLAESGNGIELVDATGGAGDLIVTQLDGSKAADALGLVDKNETVKTSVTDTLTGSDRNALETGSVFNTLIRLRDALEANDLGEISRTATKLDDDIERVTFARAEVGTRLQNLELSKQNLAEEEIQLKSALSEEIDVDLVEAISQMTSRQISLEASLRATANILQLSLLNFI